MAQFVQQHVMGWMVWASNPDKGENGPEDHPASCTCMGVQ